MDKGGQHGKEGGALQYGISDKISSLTKNMLPSQFLYKMWTWSPFKRHVHSAEDLGTQEKPQSLNTVPPCLFLL